MTTAMTTSTRTAAMSRFIAISALALALALAPLGAFAKGGSDDKVEVIVVYDAKPGDVE